MEPVRERRGYNAKITVRLFCIALSCFFLGYTITVAWNGVNDHDVSRPDQWLIFCAIGITKADVTEFPPLRKLEAVLRLRNTGQTPAYKAAMLGSIFASDDS